MPRNSSGTMSPAGSPFVPGTTISSSAVNARLADEETELTDSLSRSGKGGMTAPLRGVDGSAAAPGVSFTSELASGLYKAATGDVRIAVGGVDALKLGAGGVSGALNITTALDAQIYATTPATQLHLRGNLAAADTSASADVAVDSALARTAGNLFGVFSAAVAKLYVDWQGLLRLANQATAIQPASIWTAITPDTNVAAAGGLGYFKDGSGAVRLRGSLTNNTGGAATNLVSTSPLAAGFRPSGVARVFACAANNSTTIYINVLTTGGIATAFGTIPNGVTVFVDPISFVAEQ